MTVDALRTEIAQFLKFRIPAPPESYQVDEEVQEPGYRRLRIRYPDDEGKDIPAYLLLPDGEGPFPAALVHHQHASQRHLGKSEICGLVGDPMQAFGPALARRGVVVLAPDSICFEDRRRNKTGIEPGEGDSDDLQHYIELSYRLLAGDTLMRKVLEDAALGLSLLAAHPLVDAERLGTLGHSYGGNTVLFHAALDPRLKFSCSSGAACTYETKFAQETGIEMAEVIPGFTTRFDIQDLVRCMAPRAVLLVTAADDKFSQDADRIVAEAQGAFDALGGRENLEHKRYQGKHPLTQTQFNDIVDWMVRQAG
ncbi:MAG TPA: hypothetical protein VJ965_02270 [Anaerolineales bacterium]|nr:hypothetical protein [Anaerolineales bacterium]